jgi:outer membrane protein assembly factor BamD (BamD/ComL family)
MKILSYLFLTVLIISCNNAAQERMAKNIKALEANKNLATSDTLINSYVAFADKFPQHEHSVKYLFKAAEASVRSNRILKGIKLYERVANEYNDTALGPEALIRAGVGYSTIPDQANSKRMFDQFIQKYPTHPRIGDVRKMSEYSGLTEEELIRRVIENNQKLQQDSANNIQ